MLNFSNILRTSFLSIFLSQKMLALGIIWENLQVTLSHKMLLIKCWWFWPKVSRKGGRTFISQLISLFLKDLHTEWKFCHFTIYVFSDWILIYFNLASKLWLYNAYNEFRILKQAIFRYSINNLWYNKVNNFICVNLGIFFCKIILITKS